MDVRFLTIPLLLGATLDAQTLPDGPGKELVDVICTACHDANRIIARQGTKAEWQAKVLEMLQECPDVSQEERGKIADYLAKSFPKHVNVNTAPASELEATLDLATKDAEAIVHYREEKGRFRSVDDLKKVPGLDAAGIEAKRQRIEF